MRKIISITLLSAYLLVYGQTEKKHPIDIRLQQCFDSNINSTTLEMSKCIKEATESLDKELNKNYNTLLGLLTKEQKEKLKESQRQWIKFRDSEILFSTGFYNQKQGTMWIPIAAQTKLNLTKQRSEELYDYISTLKNE